MPPNPCLRIKMTGTSSASVDTNIIRGAERADSDGLRKRRNAPRAGKGYIYRVIKRKGRKVGGTLQIQTQTLVYSPSNVSLFIRRNSSTSAPRVPPGLYGL